ncbi:hypothetical protein GS501_00900 [Saccharibacter sp. 17.LH.SD]|uniref:hypothetical protein n=1 Tax=Saccharibacter sp. 17.LH.SD TaxID=2689393 RepID=UPI001368DC17|nr:hypothetical protein [Saccharibacter sp. 17.LH.SD]MXV43634.1 hypothetical protein [Saccharibacter sp. 17.LH.SD]
MFFRLGACGRASSQRLGLLLLTFLGTSITPLHAGRAAPVTDKPSFPTLIYWDNWADSEGATHLTKCRITSFKPIKEKNTPIQTSKQTGNTTSPQALVWTGTSQTGTATVTTNIQPQGWKSGWHASDHMEWIVPVAGLYTVKATDGTRIELTPGDILLSEDMGSIRDRQGQQGHLASNDGKEAVALLVTRFNLKSRPTHRACTQQ